MIQPDIIFISYNESNAQENWLKLVGRFPQAKRVHGVKGILKAHQKAAEKSETDFFFVVDGDNHIKKDFTFSVESLDLKADTLYVWRCENPVNDLIYGYGAIKLYNKSLIENKVTKSYIDLATTVCEKYQIVDELASETHFFNTPEEAWRGAFRECAKLSSQIIQGQKSQETFLRLEQWCSVEKNIINSEWCLRGAEQGREFGKDHKNLEKINDFYWLKQEFLKNQ